jgi:hypothetical protein
MNGWTKIKGGAKYADVCQRTFRNWLKMGLKHSRLKSGTVLIRYKAIDEFLKTFESNENKVDQIVNEVCKDL